MSKQFFLLLNSLQSRPIKMRAPILFLFFSPLRCISSYKKTAMFVTNSHFLWQDFFDKNENKEKLQKGKWKLTNLPWKTYKYSTNSVFDRLITKPFSNNDSISSYKFGTDFHLRRIFCATKCTYRTEIYTFFENGFEIYICILFENRTEISNILSMVDELNIILTLFWYRYNWLFELFFYISIWFCPWNLILDQFLRLFRIY